VTWDSHGSSDSIADRPSAAALGRGSWKVYGENILYYSNGVDYSVNGETKIQKSNGTPAQLFTNGLADLTASTAGTGAVLTAGDGGKGYKFTKTTGIYSAGHIVEFNCIPFILETDTVIAVLCKSKTKFGHGRIDITATSQASNFASSLAMYTNYEGVQFEGLHISTITGAELAAGTKVGLDIDIGSSIDKFRFTHNLSSPEELTVLEVVITPMTKPAIPITFDDAFRSQYIHAFPYMTKKSLLGSLFIISSIVENNTANILTLDHLHEMQDAGWDISNHSHKHKFAVSGYGAGYASSGVSLGAGTKNHVALSQTVAAGADFVLNGTIGSTIFDEPRHLIITCSGNDKYKRIEVTGLDEFGVIQVVTVHTMSTNTFIAGNYVWTRIDKVTSIDTTVGAMYLGVSLSYNELYEDIKTCQDFLRNNGFLTALDIFASPSGESSPLQVRVLVDLGITKMRGAATLSYEQPKLAPRPYYMASVGNGITNGGSGTLIAVKDAAKAKCSCCSIYLHDIVDDSVTSPASTQARLSDFRLLIDNLSADVKAGNITCPVISQYARESGY
jgi:hypothetical protein